MATKAKAPEYEFEYELVSQTVDGKEYFYEVSSGDNDEVKAESLARKMKNPEPVSPGDINPRTQKQADGIYTKLYNANTFEDVMYCVLKCVSWSLFATFRDRTVLLILKDKLSLCEEDIQKRFVNAAIKSLELTGTIDKTLKAIYEQVYLKKEEEKEE